jgi:hypothetical protein
MFALTNTVGSRSSVVCGQPIRANRNQGHSRRMAARIVCEDAPEKKSAKKANAASLRYVECWQIGNNVLCGSRRTAHASSIARSCVHATALPCFY